ncbi:endocuticle structural glycoprotein ABD-4-like [Culicoides brevitarsis]|uniref:endocuticle structural glycoprotein ABD-4-like n=1 Tax=Culicoides brevitarsis TaxID=469753 RepID=UPI00307B2E22
MIGKTILITFFAAFAAAAELGHLVPAPAAVAVVDEAPLLQVNPAIAPEPRILSDGEQIPILRNEQDILPDGSYTYAYETGNGIQASAQGTVKRIEDEDVVVATGEYSYTDPEGNLIRVTYIADENGFQPQGDHLPQAPEVPIAIQRALAFLATAEPYTEERSANKKK